MNPIELRHPKSAPVMKTTELFNHENNLTARTDTCDEVNVRSDTHAKLKY
jgi:hypothetical protein